MDATPAQPIKPKIYGLRVGWPGNRYQFDSTDAGPADPHHFGAPVEIYVSFAESSGVDLFDGFVCTPSWLVDAYAQATFPSDLDWVDPDADFIPGLILMRSWQPEKLRQLLGELCVESSAQTWPEAANKLSRLLQWEFS